MFLTDEFLGYAPELPFGTRDFHFGWFRSGNERLSARAQQTLPGCQRLRLFLLIAVCQQLLRHFADIVVGIGQQIQQVRFFGFWEHALEVSKRRIIC